MAARLVADIVRDYEAGLSALCIRPFDDGRFIVLVNGEPIFDRRQTGGFPQYAGEIRPRLAALS